ncbi:uncharacterized protein [Periplaneta americana]|uniref:uncharacterized protein isoform X8 n=1 Tax=Periplaneta americana TaxID=6978 RepID=UPI0037E892CF
MVSYSYSFTALMFETYPGVVMDVIKTEPEVDPLAIQSIDDVDIGEPEMSLDESNLLPPHVSWTKVDGMNSSSDLEWEVKMEDTPVLNAFPVVKCEPEAEPFEMVIVKQEINLEDTTAESEVITGRELRSGSLDGGSQATKSYLGV